MASVYRAKDDPNNLLVTHGFATTADAETFLGGTELRAQRLASQVHPAPSCEAGAHLRGTQCLSASEPSL